MTRTLEATAWTLIHFCWQAAAIAGVYGIVNMAMARRASPTRYVAALAAMLALPAAAACTFAWEMRSPAAGAYTVISASPAVTNATLSGDSPRLVTPGVAAAADQAPSAAPFVNSLPNLLRWIDGFWVVGVLALSVRGAGGWWLIHRLRATAMPQAPEAVRAAFQRMAHALGLRKTVLLRVSSAIASPVTVGALRAMVLLPVSAVTQLGPDELEVVLAHELAHVRRADFFWNLFQTVLETLFFFHPAVWWISAGIRHERELCCDDLALKICPNPVVYASALFHLEEHRARKMRLAMALHGHQPSQKLRMRIARVLGEPIPMNANGSLRPFSAAAIFAVVVVLLLSAPEVVAGFGPPQAPTPVAPIAQVSGPSGSPTLSSHSAPKPEPGTAPALPQVKPAPMELAQDQHQNEPLPPQPSQNTGTKSTYIDRMKAAGYDVDLDKMIAMKIQGATPEYAHAMSQLGFGKLSADDLIACKIQGVTPEAIAEFKKQGLEVNSIHDAISYRIFGVTAEFANGMKNAGFKDLDSKKLLALRVQGVTPEYARSIVQQYPGATMDDVIKTKIFNIDSDFIALAKKHGFNNLSLEKLVKLRISGILDDEPVGR